MDKMYMYQNNAEDSQSGGLAWPYSVSITVYYCVLPHLTLMNDENVLVHFLLPFIKVMSTHVRTMVFSHAEAVHIGSDSDIQVHTYVHTI